MSDAGALAMLLRETKPDEVYNLAAQSHVAVSFVMPKCVPLGRSRGSLSSSFRWLDGAEARPSCAQVHGGG
jgi:GDP-D-mannose dehydratase